MDETTHSPASESPRRRWPRIQATALNGFTASIVAGPSVTLIDLSRGGAQIEVAARYPMQAKVRLKLTRPTGEVTQFAATVCWAKVATIVNGKIHYRLGVGFESPIEDFIGLTGVDDQLTPIPAPPSSLPDQAAGPIASRGTAAAAETPTEIVPPRGILTPFPAARRGTATGANADSSESAEETTIDLDAIESPVTLEHKSAELARLQAAHTELTAQRQKDEIQSQQLQGELAAARQQASDERAVFERNLATAQQEFSDERATLQETLVAAEARASVLETTLRQEQQASADRDAEHRQLAQELSARLETVEAEARESAASFERQQQAWLEERAALQATVSASAAELDAAQATLQLRDQEHTAAMAEHQARFDAIVAELMQTANEQQAEYQQLLDDRTTALDEQKARAEHAEAELERTRREGQEQLLALEKKCRDLEILLTAAEAAGADSERRYKTIRREAERLLSTILSTSSASGHEHDPDIELAGPPRSQAVAGG